MSASPKLAELLARYGPERELRAGKALYYQGDEAEAAWLVLSGRLRKLRIQGGDSAAVGEAGPGSWLGLTEVYLGLPCLLDVLALEGTRLRRYSRFNFFELLREGEFTGLVLGELARENCLLHGFLLPLGAEGTVARTLAALAGPGTTGTIRLGITQAGLAEAAGLARETVNRALKTLEDEGYLETGRGEILIYDLGGLRARGD